MKTFRRIIAVPFVIIGIPLFAIAMTIRFGSRDAKTVLLATKDALEKVKSRA